MANEKVAVTPLSERDQEIVKRCLANQESLLKNVRSLMFGLPLLAEEKAHIKSVFSDKQLMEVMWRRFCPDLASGREYPLGQISEVWFRIEELLLGAAPSQIKQAVDYKQKSIEYTKHALTLLLNPDGAPVPFRIASCEEDPQQVYVMARNMYLKHIDTQLMLLNIVANTEVESEKEVEQKRIRNSSK